MTKGWDTHVKNVSQILAEITIQRARKLRVSQGREFCDQIRCIVLRYIKGAIFVKVYEIGTINTSILRNLIQTGLFFWSSETGKMTTKLIGQTVRPKMFPCRSAAWDDVK